MSQYGTLAISGTGKDFYKDRGSVKKDPRYVRLQIVEQEISEFNMLRYYLFIVLVRICSS